MTSNVVINVVISSTYSILFLVYSILLLVSDPTTAASRSAILTVNDSTAVIATVGDPLRYALTLHLEQGDRIVDRTAIAEGISTFEEVREEGQPGERKTDDGSVERTFRYLLRSYATGRFDIPPVVVKIVTASGDTLPLRSNGVSIVIRSVLPSGAEKGDIRDIKPPVEIKGQFPWKTVVLVIFLVAVVVALVWWYLRRRRRPSVEESLPTPPLPIDEIAEFERIKIEALRILARGDHKGYYTLVSEAIRRCIERRYRVEAMERTTYELERDLTASGKASQTALIAIIAFLGDCDLVKFAKYLPSIETMRAAVDIAEDIVRQIVDETRERMVSPVSMDMGRGGEGGTRGQGDKERRRGGAGEQGSGGAGEQKSGGAEETRRNVPISRY